MSKLLSLFIFLVFFVPQLFAQSPIQQFWAQNQNQYLLDKMVNTIPSVAYSVRKLRRAYTGFAMRVRRSSDNATGDVRFDANGAVSANSSIVITASGSGALTVGSSLTFSTFYSTTSVFVTTWYDQSGNLRNVSQATTSQQPRIVNAGSLEVSNSKASIKFTTTSATVLQATIAASTMFASGYIGSASLVLEASTGSTSAFGYSDGGSNRWQAHINESTNLYFDVGNGYNRLSYANSANAGVLRNYVLIAGTSLMQVWVSGTNVASSAPTMSAATTSIFNIGGIPLFPGSWYHNNHISEVIIFPKVLSNSELGIQQADQKKFYGTP